MATCPTNFTAAGNKEAFAIYQVLIEAGVSCADLDQGYSTFIEADNIVGHSVDDKAEIQGVHNGVIEEAEIVGYLLDHYEQYKDLISANIDKNWIGASFRDRGFLLGLMGEFDRSFSDFSQSLAINPQDAEAYKE